MDELGHMARDPKLRRGFEKLLFLAARRGDADLVAERLSWGIDPNCVFGQKRRAPLSANICGSSPSAATVGALLKAGAASELADAAGLTPLDYARRKLARLQAKPRRREKSPSLDENDQLQLPDWEQAELDRLRRDSPDLDADFFRLYWHERHRAARRVYNDPAEVEKVVEMLEKATGKGM